MATPPAAYGPASAYDTPPISASAVTPSDGTPLANNCRGLYIGGVGNVSVKLGNDSTAVAFSNVPAGTILPGNYTYVMATGTTATSIVALF